MIGQPRDPSPVRRAGPEPEAPAKVRVLLIEDNRFLREGIAEVLVGHGDFVVDTVSDCDDPQGQLETLPMPDVVLLDLGLEAANSIKLMTDLRRRFPDSKVVAMDILPDAVDIVSFVQAGGSGFIVKNATVSEYVDTIQAVSRGATVLPEVLARPLFAQIVESALNEGREVPDQAIRLTKREAEVVAAIAEGMSNKEIAQHLHIATFTVKSHVHNILDKLELESRIQIAAFVRYEQKL